MRAQDRIGTAKYAAIHRKFQRLLPRPERCTKCSMSPAHDLSNISDEYKDDISDWEYLCRKCHMLKDGRFSNLKRGGRQPTYLLCTKEGCENKHVARGLCDNHYHQVTYQEKKLRKVETLDLERKKA